MTTRTTSRKVTFRRPFVLKGLDEAQPAGTYEVETEEELLDTVSTLAYRRTSTMIELHPRSRNPGSTAMAVIDPEDLDAALARDAVAETSAASDGGRASGMTHAKHAS